MHIAHIGKKGQIARRGFTFEQYAFQGLLSIAIKARRDLAVASLLSFRGGGTVREHMSQWSVRDAACTLWRESFCGHWVVCAFVGLVLCAAEGAFAQGASARWARGLGGTEDDYGWGVAVDAAQNVYASGNFTVRGDFGSTNFTSYGGLDIFLAKYDRHGNPLWATHAGGVVNDHGRAVAADASGNVYLAGHFWEAATFGGTNVTGRGADDLFLAKLDSSGRWLWCATAGGVNTDEGHSVAVDAPGNCFVAGVFAGSASFGTNAVMSKGQADVAVAKADGFGQWVWAKSFGGTGIDDARGVIADAEGNCYVTGHFSGAADFGATNMTSRGGTDIFVAKFRADGELAWAQQAGGPELDEGHAVALDAAGNLYVTGAFAATADLFGTNLFAPGIGGAMDFFLVKLDAAGKLLWVQRSTGTSQEAGNALAIDAEGNVHVSGLFVGTASFGSQRLMSTSGQADVFFVKYNPAGDLVWIFQSGGPAYASANSVGVDAEGSVYGTGFFRSGTTFGGIIITNKGVGRDAFVARVDGPPRLRVTASDAQAVLSWPAWASGYRLEGAPGVSNRITWATVTNEPTVSGENLRLPQAISEQRRFFRLRAP